ncbi:MAG: transposase [Truepera sp.]|nr:transposase [Truepera sp.]
MRGVPRVDDRKVISGIIHVIRYGLIWRDAPACYGPHKTVYNREAGARPVSSTASSKPWLPKAPPPGRL